MLGDLFFSLVIGFVLSLLGAILLFLGQIGSFAGKRRVLHMALLRILVDTRHSAVLFAFGTVISLVGTGFVIGVRHFFGD